MQHVSVVHAGGTHHFEAKHSATVSSGYAVPSSATVHGKSEGVQVSGLAQQCAPPKPPPPWFLAAYGFGAWMMYLSFTPRLVWSQAGLSLLVIGVGWVLMKVYFKQAKAFGIAKRDWPNTWLCQSCGRQHVLA